VDTQGVRRGPSHHAGRRGFRGERRRGRADRLDWLPRPARERTRRHQAHEPRRTRIAQMFAAPPSGIDGRIREEVRPVITSRSAGIAADKTFRRGGAAGNQFRAVSAADEARPWISPKHNKGGQGSSSALLRHGAAFSLQGSPGPARGDGTLQQLAHVLEFENPFEPSGKL